MHVGASAEVLMITEYLGNYSVTVNKTIHLFSHIQTTMFLQATPLPRTWQLQRYSIHLNSYCFREYFAVFLGCTDTLQRCGRHRLEEY